MPGQLYFNVINDENSLTHATDDEDAAEIKSRLKMEIQRISGPISRIEKASETVMTLQGELNRISSGLRQVQEGRAEEKALYWERLAVVESLVATLQEHEEAAKAVLEKADEAFTAATRQGLAKAFSDQEKKQSEALGTWVAVLLGALTVGGVLGAYHFKEVREILANKDLSDLRVVLYLLMSALFLVGPGWFAWLATKQIGQRFRLAQDYAFKAAAASAYRGYRTEAQEIDAKAGNNELEQRLMASVLSRFDEQPLRLIEETAHGSPWHDLLSSQGGKELLARASDAVGKIPDIMKDVLAKEPKEKP